jgi:hypothetical protein
LAQTSKHRIVSHQLCVYLYPSRPFSDLPTSDSESDFITTDDWYTEYLIRPCLHVLRNEKCQSYHRCPQLPPTLHHLARRHGLPLCDPEHHRSFKQLTTPCCKVSTYSSRSSRHSSPSSPTSPPFTTDYPQRTRFRSVLPLLFPDGWTSPPSAFQAT